MLADSKIFLVAIEVAPPAKFITSSSPDSSKTGILISERTIVTNPSLFLLAILFKVVSANHASELPNEYSWLFL